MRRNRDTKRNSETAAEQIATPSDSKKVRIKRKPEPLPLRDKSARIAARKKKAQVQEKEHAAKSPEAPSSEKDVSSKTIDVLLAEKKPADAPVAKHYVPSLENILLLDVAEGEIEEPEVEQIEEFGLESLFLFPLNTSHSVLPEPTPGMPREQAEEIVGEMAGEISPEIESYKSNLSPLELENEAARNEDHALTLYKEMLAQKITSMRSNGLFQAPLQKIRNDLKALSSRSTFREYKKMILDLLTYQYSAYSLIQTSGLSDKPAYFNMLVELTEFFSNGMDRQLLDNDSLNLEEMAFLSQLNGKLRVVKTSGDLSLVEKGFYFFVVMSTWLQSRDKHNPEVIKGFLLLAKHFSNVLKESLEKNLAEKDEGNIKGPSL